MSVPKSCMPMPTVLAITCPLFQQPKRRLSGFNLSPGLILNLFLSYHLCISNSRISRCFPVSNHSIIHHRNYFSLPCSCKHCTDSYLSDFKIRHWGSFFPFVFFIKILPSKMPQKTIFYHCFLWLLSFSYITILHDQ